MDDLFRGAYKGKRVLVTGHTGFNGSWLTMWLLRLGANVAGYSLDPPTSPSLYKLLGLDEKIQSFKADVRNSKKLEEAFKIYNPEIVFHLAAQSLVRISYKEPKMTFETNILGTVNIFEAVRKTQSVRAVVNVTSDKCYENKETLVGYKESDSLGGNDPYSSSKGCAELITTAYRNSYFNVRIDKNSNVALASARTGNVIGGGDWATDRLIPDCLKYLLRNKTIVIRNPNAIRPWQHVLEPLSGYLLLGKLLYEKGIEYAQAWNFGPKVEENKSVEWMVKKICEKWGKEAKYKIDNDIETREAKYLILNSKKTKEKLGWFPRWNLEKALDATVAWTESYLNKKDSWNMCHSQISEYSRAIKYGQ